MSSNMNASVEPISGKEDLLNKLELHKKAVRGVLLYDEDSHLQKYIQKHFQQFHKLSGDWCQIFALEKPDNKWRQDNLSLIERFKLKFMSEIDPNEAYDIARELKIDINQIPCLVLFGEEINSQRLIIPIREEVNTDFTSYFKELFAKIEKILANASNSTTRNLSGVSAFNTISYHFDEIINYLNKYAQEISSQKQYLYKGSTIITQILGSVEGNVNIIEGDNNNAIQGNDNKVNQGDTIMTGDRNINTSGGNYNERIQGDYVQGNYYATGQSQSLAQAAAEIQELLKQLEQTYPTTTTSQQMVVAAEAINRIESNPTMKQKVINAVKEGGLAAFEKAIDNPAGAFIVGAIKGWQEVEAED